TLFFQATNGVSGLELWKSNGTAAGTVLVKDINPGKVSSSPSYLTNVNGTLFFSANNGVNGVEPRVFSPSAPAAGLAPAPMPSVVNRLDARSPAPVASTLGAAAANAAPLQAEPVDGSAASHTRALPAHTPRALADPDLWLAALDWHGFPAIRIGR